MGLETGTYISDLNASNPVHATDQVSQGDDHIRLIKSVILNTFPNVNGSVDFTPAEANLLDGLTGITGSGNLVASASPTLTGTLMAAAANFSGALTALSYGGITEANLLDKSAAETITGTWGFAAITATSYDGIAAADLVDKGAAETITGQWNFSTGPQVADIELGHASDTTLTRAAAGDVEVEGRAMLAHDDGAFGSGRIHVSTSAPSGGSDGDIWLEREA